MKMLKKIATIIIILIVLCSCKEHKNEYEFKKKTLYEKREALVNGTTSYFFAYTNGTSEEVSYGLYATTKPKDTLYFIRERDYILGLWQVIDKELFYEYYNDSNLHK